jgi:hypothetical protein
MDRGFVRSARDGFVGSFRLAAMMILALVAVVSGFIDGNGDGSGEARQGPQSRFH